MKLKRGVQNVLVYGKEELPACLPACFSFSDCLHWQTCAPPRELVPCILLTHSPPPPPPCFAVWISGIVQTVIYCDFFW